MRRLLLLSIGVALVSFGWVFGQKPTKDEPDAADVPARNDITPDAKAWQPFRDGLEVQIVVPNRQVNTATTTLPCVIWFRNSTKQALVLQSNMPAFVPHGELLFTNKDGVNFLEGHCAKKHAKDDVTFAPGEQRGFLCDVLQQHCHRWRATKLPAGEYTITFADSNKTRVMVVE